MSITIRFGDINDLKDVSNGDQHVPPHLLLWKLQNQEIIIAKNKADLVGYLRLEYLWSKYPYLGLIIVHPDYRGNGLGKGLLEFAQAHLRKKGMKKIYSSSQANESDPQKWHRKMGFQECGIINGINDGDIGELFFAKEI
ncbi:GNAT family N-acetyltransferase [Cohnella sp. LGH]|uniref:GNAT family N-acetyltransferase n=1 Tax=Cohnella sp. LGH TaxID=1619153 RepID=UPI001ADC7501|nr:GNAT family N-acetyltransferase [Cohnella sp. LGH]QTH45800.1 GNAT family N-acetyltransferase [Cohnella sp. LGH]